jgi:hypothetical protein
MRSLGALKQRTQRGGAAPRGQQRGVEAAERSARALTALIDSLVSFVRYLNVAGETGAWSADVRAHVEELHAALARVVWKSNPK